LIECNRNERLASPNGRLASQRIFAYHLAYSAAP
jgi:hypothetical protein